MGKLINIAVFCLVVLSFTFVNTAQTKKPKKPVKPAPVVSATPKPTPQPVEPPKLNKRPGGEPVPTKEPVSDGQSAYSPAYFYEFTRPGFTYPRILIEHDEAGKGKISFLKDGFDELLTDPIDLSTVTLTKINDTLAALNFLDSTESYQHTRDFSNLGNVTITIKKAGRERTVKFNWTDNKNAKLLMDEYRRIGNEYTWRFEITTARENFPLQTPGLMDTLGGYLKRNEISDPQHLLPFLTTLSTDERLPLMARNRAAKLVTQIEKEKK